MKTIICVKLSSLSDFELYLLAEIRGLDYKALKKIKSENRFSKIWIELPSGMIVAVQRDGKSIDPYISMSEYEIAALSRKTPVLAGEPTRKFRGDIESKRAEFNEFTEEEAKKNGTAEYDHRNIVCINARHTLEQIFAASIANDVDPVEAVSFVFRNSHIDMTKVCFEKKTANVVYFAFMSGSQEVWQDEDPSIPLLAKSKMSKKPVDTPKIKATPESIEKYQNLKSAGIPISIPKLDRMKFREGIESLKKQLEAALAREDYEEAARLRDLIAKPNHDI